VSAQVARIHAMRVLVLGRDRRFLRVASAVLGQAGHTARTTEKSGELWAVMRFWRPNVVVLDVTGAVGSHVRTAAAIEAGHPDTAVVLVGDGAGAARCGALPKWSALEELAESVESRYLGVNTVQGVVDVFA
jgi:DNA-binding NtrC family response regulator